MPRLSLLALCCWATLGAVARADVTQPDGEVIPLGTSLSGYLNGSANNDNLNEGLDVVKDGAVEPQTFQPQCDFNGKYIAKGGGANFAVGWYNVDAARASGNPPRYLPRDTGANLNVAAAGSDIQILFPFSSSLPAAGAREISSSVIRQSASYRGGLIGLVLVPNPNGSGSGNATQYHYTEHRFSTSCTQCSRPGPWYSILTYRSKLLANTFYLGFEDLDFRDAPGSQGVNGNDLDYEDFLFRFTGLSCPGAGLPCEDPAGIGACRAGLTDCDAQGKPICRPKLKAGSQPELCDGEDNDCDGTVDNGAVCAGGQLCYRGLCVKRCGGEIGCALGLRCEAGVCVEAACFGKTCPAGELCRGGTCQAPCGGVICPGTQVCRTGRCVDPCSGVTCATGTLCQSGICLTGCSCGSCPAGKSCDATSQRCVEPACQGKSCAATTHCSAGQCVDDCQGATCPSGESCTGGKCVTAPGPDAGSPGLDAGSLILEEETDSGVAVKKDGGSGGAGADQGGCGCHASGAAPLLGLAPLALLLLRRRTREEG